MAPYTKIMMENGMSNGSIWHRNDGSVVDTGTESQIFNKFIASRTGEAITIAHELVTHGTILFVADAIVACLAEKGAKAVIRSPYANTIFVESDVAICTIQTRDRNSDQYSEDDSSPRCNAIFQSKIGVFKIEAIGDRNILQYIVASLTKTFEGRRYASIKWWNRGPHGLTNRMMWLSKPNTVLRPEFYPTLKNPENFIREYLAADESVLIMYGAPGTGKTTLLRHMIYEHNLAASVVYDEALMEQDAIFQSFLFDGENDILIIEDADTIITSREIENNKLMSRFLNISDGLIKLPNKKLVFTTNLTDIGKVDQALLRAGRCFDAVHTRPLTHDEAIRAAKAANLPIPQKTGEYTVAELFHQSASKHTTRRVGFTAA